MTGFNPLADEHYFLAVYPDGTGRLEDKVLTWNGGACCGYAQANNIDDVAFVRVLLQDLRQFTSMDEARLYATGISNGGIMSYRLACEAADLFAAVAPVSGTLNYAACSPSEPVPVLHIHGTADEHLPYDGGKGDESLTTTDFASVADTIAFWVQADGCAPIASESRAGSVIHSIYTDCAPGTGVELYTIVGGLHAWPGSDGPGWPGGDEPSPDLEASEVIWEFFRAHPKP
jgi:polyhydroxybutyrate depolymerase